MNLLVNTLQNALCLTTLAIDMSGTAVEWGRFSSSGVEGLAGLKHAASLTTLTLNLALTNLGDNGVAALCKLR